LNYVNSDGIGQDYEINASTRLCPFKERFGPRIRLPIGDCLCPCGQGGKAGFFSMTSIITVTVNPALDKSTQVDRVAAEQKLSCRSPNYDPGGGGVNVARAISKLGGNALAFYLVGGAIGEMVQDLLEHEEIAQHAIPIKGVTRSNLTVLDESSGQQYRFGMPGPPVEEDEWSEMLDSVRKLEPGPQYVVASGSLPPGVPQDFYARLAAVARQRGARFVVDTRGEPLRAAVASGVFLIKPNARELSMLAGAEVTTEEEQEAMARELVDSGQSEVVVVSLGAAGALLATSDICTRIRAPSVRTVSKIGAGDSMVGGIVLALARGESIVDAVRYGVAAGAAAVTTPGTQLFERGDVERLYDKISRNSSD
jgi:6-phosphofructokinase 2